MIQQIYKLLKSDKTPLRAALFWQLLIQLFIASVKYLIVKKITTYVGVSIYSYEWLSGNLENIWRTSTRNSNSEFVNSKTFESTVISNADRSRIKKVFEVDQGMPQDDNT